MKTAIGVIVPVICGGVVGVAFASVLLGLIVATLVALALGEM